MNCNCKWTEGILAVIIIVFSVIWMVSWEKWIIFAAGVILLLHSFCCKNCGTSCMPEAKKTSTKKKKK